MIAMLVAHELHLEKHSSYLIFSSLNKQVNVEVKNSSSRVRHQFKSLPNLLATWLRTNFSIFLSPFHYAVKGAAAIKGLRHRLALGIQLNNEYKTQYLAHKKRSSVGHLRGSVG